MHMREEWMYCVPANKVDETHTVDIGSLKYLQGQHTRDASAGRIEWWATRGNVDPQNVGVPTVSLPRSSSGKVPN